MRVHGTADVKKQQHLHLVVPLRHHPQVEIAGILGGRPDGARHIQLFQGTLPGEVAQPAQGHLDVAGAKLHRIVQILELALVPHLHRPPVAGCLLTDADPLRVVAVGAERGGAAGSHPLAPPLVPLLLFFNAFFQCLQQLVQSAEGLDLLLFLFAQEALRQLAQPFLGDFSVQFLQRIGRTLEMGGEGPVELVEMALILYQADSGQVIKVLHAAKDQVLLQSLKQGQKFHQGDGKLGTFQP